jgi:hypothetical protein
MNLHWRRSLSVVASALLGLLAVGEGFVGWYQENEQGFDGTSELVLAAGFAVASLCFLVAAAQLPATSAKPVPSASGTGLLGVLVGGLLATQLLDDGRIVAASVALAAALAGGGLLVLGRWPFSRAR